MEDHDGGSLAGKLSSDASSTVSSKSERHGRRATGSREGESGDRRATSGRSSLVMIPSPNDEALCRRSNAL